MDPRYNQLSGFLSPDQADILLAHLLPPSDIVSWQQVTWSTGKPLPRLVCSIIEEAPPLMALRKKIENCFNIKIRSIWANLYRNGNDYTPEHQDSYGGYVFTICLGQERDFIFRKIEKDPISGKYERIKLLTQHGDLSTSRPRWTPNINIPSQKANRSSEQEFH